MSHPGQRCPWDGTLLLWVSPCPPGSCSRALAEEPSQSLPPALSALVCSSGLLQCFAGVNTSLSPFARPRKRVLHPRAVQQSQTQQGPNEHQRLPTTSSNAGALCNHHTVASMQSCPHRVTLPPTSPLLSTNTISNRCTLVHGTGAEGFFPPAKAWGPHVPPPHRGLSSPKPPRCGVRGGIPISKGAKLGLEGARQPRVQETLLQEAELLCWKERSEISKQRGEKATNACAESPLQNRTLSNHCLLFPFDFSFFWLLEIPSPGTKQRKKKKGSEQSSVRHSQL